MYALNFESENTQKIFHINEQQLLLCFMPFQLMKGFMGVFLFWDSGENLYFPDNDDWLMWLYAEDEESTPNTSGVGERVFRRWAVIYFLLRVKIRNLYDTFLSLFFSVFIEVCFYYIFRCLSMLIFRKICTLWQVCTLQWNFFQIHYFFVCFELGFYTEIYLYMYYSYLHRNIFKFIIFCCLLCIDFYYGIFFMCSL